MTRPVVNVLLAAICAFVVYWAVVALEPEVDGRPGIESTQP